MKDFKKENQNMSGVKLAETYKKITKKYYSAQDQDIIDADELSYNLRDEYSESMKVEVQKYIELNQMTNSKNRKLEKEHGEVTG